MFSESRGSLTQNRPDVNVVKLSHGVVHRGEQFYFRLKSVFGYSVEILAFRVSEKLRRTSFVERLSKMLRKTAPSLTFALHLRTAAATE